MRILALQPWGGGSHGAFLRGWAMASRHDFTLLELPARHWRWRMRHGAVTLADRTAEAVERGAAWDLLFATSMLDLATFVGLAGTPVAALPRVLYFHENQLTYPTREEEPRDLHYAYTHFTGALAADALWFNSAYHKEAFFDSMERLLGRMPDHGHGDWFRSLHVRAAVESPGVEPVKPPPERAPGPLRILWAHRWEHDKGPEDLFAALRLLVAREVPFSVRVHGQTFDQVPACFAEARGWLGARVAGWGEADAEAYRAALAWSDVAVSTARQENFGIAMVEAACAGAYPVAPDRLAYPEVFDAWSDALYDGTVEGLAARLAGWAAAPETPRQAARTIAPALWARYAWRMRARAMDEASEQVRRLPLRCSSCGR